MPWDVMCCHNVATGQQLEMHNSRRVEHIFKILGCYRDLESLLNDSWGVLAIDSVVSKLEREEDWADTHRMCVAGFCIGGGAALRYAGYACYEYY